MSDGLFLLVLLLVYTVHLCLASSGDSSPYFQKCLERCSILNCTIGDDNFKRPDDVDLSLKLLQWSCLDDCKYNCMWGTVEGYINRNWKIPQFYGKWPFIRILGIQEPASALFSVMNLLVHVLYLRRLRQEIKQYSLLLFTWQLYAVVSIHAWIWSTVFHCRDVLLTEIMDYICAFSIVVFAFNCTGLRLMQGLHDIYKYIFVFVNAVIFIKHVLYLSTGIFDYGYNIFLNVCIGGLGCVCWLFWSIKSIRKQPYVWKILLFATLMPVALSLEILDFPPMFWIIDAHSLWHMITAPITILFYSFVLDDIKYLTNLKRMSSKSPIKKII